MSFDIRSHVEFDSKDRAVCPSCNLSKGVGYKARNLSLVPNTNNAYKCHAGCSSEEIRDAIGKPKDKIVPTAIAVPPKNVLVTPQKVKDAYNALMDSHEPKGWLDDRGIYCEIATKYKLGLTRSKFEDKFYPAITIPIPSDEAGTHYYQKKRVAPWIPEDKRPEGLKPWSQYGIPMMVYFTHKPEEATETWLCEGEWDAIRLGHEVSSRNWKDVAVACFTCGAPSVPPQEQLDRLPGEVIVFYDQDDAGREGALKVQEKMKDRCRIATLPSPQDHGKKGYDVSNALDDGLTLSAFNDATDAATPWTEPKRVNPLRHRLQTNDEMMAGASDHVEWLVPDILTQDELFILGMPPRGGKSLFCLTLAKAVATGGPFLDRPTTQGSVIYINLEDAPTKIKQRQIAQGWSDGLPVYWMEKFKLSELDDLKELAAEIPDLRLVVLDTFSRIRDDGQKESSAELGKILEPIQEWAKEQGICVLIVHHTGKVSNDHPSADPFDALRGSTSIRATCRGAIVIVPGESSYRLLAENGYADRLDVSVRIVPDTLEWKLLGNWQPRIDGDMKTQILDHLNLIGESTVSDIAKDLNFNATSVGTALSRLSRDGVITKAGGIGRLPARYSRSLNLLKQLETQFETYNPDSVRDTGLLKQDTFPKDLDKKVIIEPESDHSALANEKCASSETENAPMITFASNDHFSPTQREAFKQSHNPDGVSDVCLNDQNDCLSYAKQTGTRRSTMTVGSQVRYSGNKATLSKLCSSKKLTVLEITGDHAVVKHDDWVVTQTIPTTDLKPCK
jgi:hypothetical protein